jgi:hypothetical protein
MDINAPAALVVLAIIVVSSCFILAFNAKNTQECRGLRLRNKKGKLGIVGLVIMLFGILGLSKYIKNYM